VKVSEYASYDATGLAELIVKGEVSVAEVHEAARAAIDQVEPQLSAIAGERFEEPLAYDPSGVFAGVPFAIKDLVTHAKGTPTRSGSRLFGAGVRYPYDNFLMARFRRAGLATMAVTRTPEFGFNAATEAIVYGEPTRNPWDTARSPGGSSGGSAALVASRALPIAHGNDGGGSLRAPAAACGLVGLKPSRGRVTVGPDFADPLLGLGVEFGLSRSVRDAAALLDAVHGAEPGERYLLPAPEKPFTASAAEGSKPLRVALAWELFTPAQVIDPQVKAAVEAIAKALEGMGHRVDLASPSINLEAFLTASFNAWCAFLAYGVVSASAALGVVPSADNLEATTLACAEHGKALRALDVFEMDRAFNAISRAFGAFFESYDVILTPTMVVPNVAVGYLNANDPTLSARGWFNKLFAVLGTGLYNVTGTPAISLPLAESREGWPIGIQFAARNAGESTLLALAGDLERAMPWAGREPKVMAR
jgi:amidase